MASKKGQIALESHEGALFEVMGERVGFHGEVQTAEISSREVKIRGWFLQEGGMVQSIRARGAWRQSLVRFTPGLLTPEVEQKFPHEPEARRAGFECLLSLPEFFLSLHLKVVLADGAGVVQLRPARRLQRQLMKRLRVNVLYHYPAWAKPIKRRLLGKDVARSGVRKVPLSRFFRVDAPGLGSIEAEVILPVYNGLRLVQRLVPKLAADPQVSRLIVIDDASPDETVRDFLDRQAREFGDGRILLLRNERNLGFVGTVNRGLEAASGDCIILNSDVDVPPNWVPRLMAPLKADSSVASVTPFTNAGTIMSFPALQHNNTVLNDIDLERIDRQFQRLLPVEPLPVLPTGVGFCMAISRRALDKVGVFDEETFGRGYGEENDWSRRAVRHGFVHRVALNLYVLHELGGSFESAEGEALREANAKVLEQRHPDYRTAVRNFIRENPLAPYRDAAFLAILTAECWKEVHLIFDHSHGGGATVFRESEIRGDRVDAGALVVSWDPGRRVYRMDARYRDYEHVIEFGTLDDLFGTITRLPVHHVHINSLVFDPNPRPLLSRLKRYLESRPGLEAALYLHDFYPLCPSHNLLDRHGAYCGLPDESVCARCLPRNPFVGSPNVRKQSIAEWRETWESIFPDVTAIRAFSGESAALFRKIFPGAAESLVVRGHEKHDVGPPLPKHSSAEPLVVGVIGHIGYPKGARVVADLAKRAGLKIVVLGAMDYKLARKGGIDVHGSYELSELRDLIRRYRVTLGFIPSICPETYNFVADELMQLGLPVVCFGIGAPAGRVRNYHRGLVMPLDLKDDPVGLADEIRAFYAGLV